MSKCLVLFVEGDTEVEFYKQVVANARKLHPQGRFDTNIEYRNVGGVGGFKSIALRKFVKEIKPKYDADCEYTVVLCSDTDVFDFAAKPPIKWDEVKKELRDNGASSIIHVQARRSIEDWFLYDLEGILGFLRLGKNTKVSGKNGYDKLQRLYKQANKVYFKGIKSNGMITLEEKLVQALVPVEEQPYEVPGNWCWVKMETISTLISKGTTPQGGRDAYLEKGVNFLRVENFLDNGKLSDENMAHISEETHMGYLKRSILQRGDVLISIAGTLGKTAIVDENMLPMNTNQAVAFIRLIDVVNPHFIRLFLTSPKVQELLLQQTKVTSIPNLTLKIVSDCFVALPPLAEQQRIVDRIESLFAKLDEAKDKVRSVLDESESRKAAILHKAFSGELTAKWRMGRNICVSKYESINSCCHSLKYGTSKKSEDNGDVVVIRMGNLQGGEIDWTNLAYSSDMEDIKKYELKKGDVLFNRTNSPELVGKTSIYRGEYPAIYAGYLIKLEYDTEKLCGEYLNYLLNSPDAKEYCNKVKSDGVNQSNINARKLGAFEIPVPTHEEQQEIVNILNKVLEREKKIKEFAEDALEKISELRSSILAKAFRGELGTNNLDEQNAIELLKSTLDRIE